MGDVYIELFFHAQIPQTTGLISDTGFKPGEGVVASASPEKI